MERTWRENKGKWKETNGESERKIQETESRKHWKWKENKGKWKTNKRAIKGKLKEMLKRFKIFWNIRNKKGIWRFFEEKTNVEDLYRKLQMFMLRQLEFPFCRLFHFVFKNKKEIVFFQKSWLWPELPELETTCPPTGLALWLSYLLWPPLEPYEVIFCQGNMRIG